MADRAETLSKAVVRRDGQRALSGQRLKSASSLIARSCIMADGRDDRATSLWCHDWQSTYVSRKQIDEVQALHP